jgi:hypothetical protein
MKREQLKKRKKSVVMKARLLKETQAEQDLEEIEEERREEMIAASTLLQRLQVKLEKALLKGGCLEEESLVENLKRPSIEGRIMWPLQWEFNQVLRELGILNYGEHKVWVQPAIADLEWILARIMKWI